MGEGLDDLAIRAGAHPIGVHTVGIRIDSYEKVQTSRSMLLRRELFASWAANTIRP